MVKDYFLTVIPGHREAMGPESIRRSQGYGFRTRHSVAPRNDGDKCQTAFGKKDWAPAFAGANGVCQ